MKIREDYTETLSSWLFRLEFNEEKQQWHYERHDSERLENSFGWNTIISCASQLEIEAYIMFIESKKKKRLSVDFLLRKKNEWVRFYNELTNNFWAIVPIEREIS